MYILNIYHLEQYIKHLISIRTFETGRRKCKISVVCKRIKEMYCRRDSEIMSKKELKDLSNSVRKPKETFTPSQKGAVK